MVNAEPGVDYGHVAATLAEELRLMAAWLELDRVEVDDLAPVLAACAP